AGFEARAITWRPQRLSPSFHGRDLFAPVAAALASGNDAAVAAIADSAWRQPEWLDDLAQVIYLDQFGNAITGLRAAKMSKDQAVQVNGDTLTRARTFSDMPVGRAFWYENANGLVEIAVNQGSAARDLGLTLGTAISLP
ncbi:MAG: SAM-dependent chlorinase/fluorinase, partial [Alphaproteobacteria bacterium]|nr:SAM-dependent chlorinase/fluorinase [Alphaproteobacteria bacterium]